VRRKLRAACCATWGLVAAPLAAQSDLTPQSELALDAGVAHVLYEGYLPSGVATLSPSVNAVWPLATLDVRGTISRFTSGNIAAQGTLSGSIFTRPKGALRGEVAGLVGGTSHQTVGSTASALAHARLHWLDSLGRGGVWIGGGAGQNRDPLGTRGILQGTAGGWLRRGSLSLNAALRPTRFDEGEYLEAEVLMRLRSRRFELSLGGGARSGAQVGERTSWGEVEGVLWLRNHLGLVAGLASFPADPTRGLLGGRSAAIAIRLSTRSPPTSAAAVRIGGSTAALPEFELSNVHGETRLVRIRAPDAQRVELMGDFTDWSPIALARVSAGVWELTLPIAAGAHLINIRVDGGPWRVPGGVTETADDFGGVVGLIAVP
jgi:predicted carbohydrate-binding protein with CBM48